MAVMTLLEAGKLMEPSRKAGVVQTYADTYQVLQVAPVISTGGKAAYQWTIEDDLAHTSGKRNVNADFTAAEGNVKPFETNVKIYGGKIQVDEYIKDHSPASVSFQEASQVRSFARDITIDVFEGAGGTSLRGLRHWFGESGFSGQQISAGATANGVLLSTAMLDELEGIVARGPNTYFYMRELIARRLRALSKGQATGEQRMVYSKNEFGMWAWRYDGIPIVILRDGKNTDLLSVTEPDGHADLNETTCSVYLVDWSPETCALFSSSNIIGANGVPLPKLTVQNDGSNYMYERLTWYVGLVPHIVRGFGRIRHIKNAVA